MEEPPRSVACHVLVSIACRCMFRHIRILALASLSVTTQMPTVEKLWHLFVPPTMTLLDDYEAKYKLRGVQLVSQLLDVSPPDLLRRTGIDSLILTVSTPQSGWSALMCSPLSVTVAQDLLGIPPASRDPQPHPHHSTDKCTIDRAYDSRRVCGPL